MIDASTRKLTAYQSWKCALKTKVLIKKYIYCYQKCRFQLKRDKEICEFNILLVVLREPPYIHFTCRTQGPTNVYFVQLSKLLIKKERICVVGSRYSKSSITVNFYKKKMWKKVKKIMIKVWNFKCVGHLWEKVFFLNLVFWECCLVWTMLLIKKIVCGSLSRTKDYSYGHVHQQSSNYSKTMCCVTKQLQKLTFAE